MPKLKCPKCGRKISTKKEDVSKGYFGVCLHCDEDFYIFELQPRTIASKA